MTSSLSNLVNNLFKGIHRITRKYGHDDKKCKTFGIEYKYSHYFLEYTNFKDHLVEYKYLCSNKNYHHRFDEKLKDRFSNTYNFSNHDNNKFIWLRRKGVYPYEYMDDWEKFNELSLPEKEDFCSHFSTEDITYADYILVKTVCKDF